MRRELDFTSLVGIKEIGMMIDFIGNACEKTKKGNALVKALKIEGFAQRIRFNRPVF